MRPSRIPHRISKNLFALGANEFLAMLEKLERPDFLKVWSGKITVWLPLVVKPFFILKSCTAKFKVQKAFILFSISWRQTYKMATYLDRHTFLKVFPEKYHRQLATLLDRRSRLLFRVEFRPEFWKKYFNHLLYLATWIFLEFWWPHDMAFWINIHGCQPYLRHGHLFTKSAQNYSYC